MRPAPLTVRGVSKSLANAIREKLEVEGNGRDQGAPVRPATDAALDAAAVRFPIEE